MFQRLHNVFATLAEPWISCGRETRERVHDCQHTYLSPGDQLIVYEVHRPSLIALRRFNAILAQLRLHAPFWRFVPQLKTHFIVKAVNPLGVHLPSFTAEQHMDSPVPIVDTRFCYLFDAFLELGLLVAMCSIVVS